MAGEGIFNDLNLNPLIFVQDDNDTDSTNTQDDNLELEDNKALDDKSKVKEKRTKEEEFIELDTIDEDKDDIPLRNSNSNENEEEIENNDNSFLKQWVTFYREEGLISEDVKDEDIIDNETLFEKLKEQQLNTANALLENYKSQLPGTIKQLVEAWEEGAEGEAFKKVVELKAEQIELGKLTPESIKADVETQKNVVRNYLKRTTNHSNDKIEKYIKRLEDMEDLLDEAIVNADELKTLIETEEKTIRDQAKETEKKRLKDAQDQREELTKYIKDTKTIIPDLAITDGERKEVENLIFNPIAKDQNGNPIFYIQKLFNDNPKEMAVKMNYLAVVTKGFTDWSKLFKKAETKISKKVEKLLETPPPRTKGKTNSQVDESWRDNLKRLQRQ